MAEVKKLVLQRSSIKGQLTRMINYLESDREIDLAEAQIRKKKVDELWYKFEETQTEIDLLRTNAAQPVEGQDVYAVIEEESAAEREIVEASYFDAASRLHRLIEAEQERLRPAVPPDNPGEPRPVRDSIERKMDIKLPTLKLPEFSGEYKEWLLFKDTFRSMIHENTSLTPIQKFQYLRSALSGEALQVIGGLETSAVNYASAWELLTKNYENDKLLINIHLNQLLEFPAISKDKSATIKQLIVHVRTHLKALKTLKLPVDHWDELLIHLVKGKLDYNMQKDWEEETNRNKTATRPTLEQFLTFLNEHCRTLEMIDRGKSKPDQGAKIPPTKKLERKVSLASAFQGACPVCNETHMIWKCPNFLRLSVPDRVKEVKAKRLCLNCLGRGHYTAVCPATDCKKCQRKHHTMLHLELEAQPTTEGKATEQSSKETVVTHCLKEATTSINFVKRPISQVILSTARVNIEGDNGIKQSCRLLLDPGSQSNLITEDLVRKLQLKCKRRSELISGVNRAQTTVARIVEVKIRSMYVDYETTLECLVLPHITERLPQVRINTQSIQCLDGLELADPNFNIPGTIDLLVGAGLFWQLICPESIQPTKHSPRLQNTLLGWIVGGEIIDSKPRTTTKVCGVVTNSTLQAQVERFWTQEETQETRCWNQEEVDCERQFLESVQRDSVGRFTVALPKKQEVILGDSEDHAKRRLYSLERRFRAKPEVKREYIRFMEDYEKEGHMSLVPANSEARQGETYTLPHQPVIKLDSLTTKLRVVFDASAKTSLGTALNDKLMIGPNLQRELFDITLRFRSHAFVMTADIAAFFRQILVQEEDRDLQRIFWRPDETEPIRTYRLNTVTYGTAPAPYLAIRCLRQLAADDSEFPLAARALQNDFYMDDVLTGADTVEEAKALQQQLSQLLRRGAFQLRRWRASDPRILEDLLEQSKVDNLLKIEKEGAMKTLGLLWNAESDTLQYEVKVEEASNVTKRLVLSRIAQIFDPLGLLGPVVIQSKCIMQQMWQLQTGWDEPIPAELQSTWNEYYYSLPRINEVRIPRNVNPGNIDGSFTLVGFGDASERAYGACLYAVYNTEEKSEAHLITSKSRVAPLKTVSLPRLELNAALLLAKLCSIVKKAYGEKVSKIFLFSDSTITLSWIVTPPNIRKTYVANRVNKIQELSASAVWLHVASKDNPADLLSRGITVDDWKDNELWWHGPKWLATDTWPQGEEIRIDMSEMKTSAVLVNTNATANVLERFSSYEKLRRVIAYCLRFRTNARGGRLNGPLSVAELTQAEKAIAKMTQKEAFPLELQALERENQVSKGSTLAALNPILDDAGLIRVGGRISRASLPDTAKHPILLPSKHHITRIIMEREHLRLHHCGPEQLLCSVRHQYWPLSGRIEARKVTRNCLRCFRSRPKVPDVIMGDLPSDRVRGGLRPFTNTGVDYAGPLQLRESRRRGRVHTSNAWIAVFVCLATKAVHLELVTDLTTESFLSALRRFTARRGVCSKMISDNGTNFVGASRELGEVYQFLQDENETIANALARQKIEWKFIPPRAPHFGGLWEAAVKAAKRHLNTVTQGLVLTYEEYYTLLVEVEAVLNSRPLTPLSPLSSDPNDSSVLTPAHFLVGDTLLFPVEHSHVKVPVNRLSRWQHIQKVRQHFWERWHQEYLQELQKRQKWCTRGENLKEGTLVLLKEDNVPSLQWILGRIVQVHPGADGVVRVATVRTPSGVYKRAVKKLCPLPAEHEE